MKADAWDIPVGAFLTRDERRLRFGGALYGGIEQSAQTPNVFVYSDPESGTTYGYDYDGWVPDSNCFLYTGEGRVGPQVFTDGNKALLNHRVDGRAVRLFVADGIIEGTDTKKHRYVGEFEVDEETPYLWETAPDVNGDIRPVIVFRLKAITSEGPQPETLSPAPEIALPHVTQVPLEAVNTPAAQRSGQDAVQVERRESLMVERLRLFLNARGCTLKRFRLRPEGERASPFTDPYWVEGNELFEAKSNSTRESVRMAVGQLLDYRRLIGDPNITLTAVFPEAPSSDLQNYLSTVRIGCVFEEAEGQFTRARLPN